MMVITSSLLLLGLLHTASSTTLYPQAAQRPAELLSDFQKNNISSSWAPGHPIDWTKKSAEYTFSDGGPIGYTSGALRAAELSSDEKYLVSVNYTYHVSVVKFDTGTTVFGTTLAPTETCLIGTGGCYPEWLRVLDNPKGGYDVLVTSTHFGTRETHRLRLSSNGTQIGNTTIYEGKLCAEFYSPSTSPNQRRFLVGNPTNIYDLDDASVHLELSQQENYFGDCSFSSDGQIVATTSPTRVFNATTGALVHDFGSTGSVVLSISPDGSWLATSHENDGVQIWSLRNTTAEPITLNLASALLRGFSTGLVWSPDGSYLAAGGYENIYVWDMKSTSPRLAQHWEMTAYSGGVMRLFWLGGTKQLAYRAYGGLEVYDFETNLKYRWGWGNPGHWTDAASQSTSTYYVKEKGWIGGLDSDAQVRFWKHSV